MKEKQAFFSRFLTPPAFRALTTTGKSRYASMKSASGAGRQAGCRKTPPTHDRRVKLVSEFFKLNLREKEKSRRATECGKLIQAVVLTYSLVLPGVSTRRIGLFSQDGGGWVWSRHGEREKKIRRERKSLWDVLLGQYACYRWWMARRLWPLNCGL